MRWRETQASLVHHEIAGKCITCQLIALFPVANGLFETHYLVANGDRLVRC